VSNNLLQMIFAMVIPTAVFIYTISFGRWMKRKGLQFGFLSAVSIGFISYATTGWVLWRLIT
jgi:hypothetical protein